MSKSAKTAVATKAEHPVALAGDFSSMAGQGFDNLSRDDLAIPFLTILQSNSPQVKRSDGAYIDGAQEGMLLNTVSKALLDTQSAPVTLVACAYSRAFVEWRTREKGGGYVAEHNEAQGEALLRTCERDEKGRDILPNGNQLNDTRTFYVLVVDADGVPSPAVLTMTSTQIRKSKQWLMQQNMLKLKSADGRAYTPPMFASKWHVKTVAESNEKGSWFGWAFEHAGYFKTTDDPVFQAAMELAKSVKTGATKANHAAAADSIDPETGEIRRGGDQRPEPPEAF